MSEKHYDTDWAKTKSRDMAREFYATTLLKFRKPNDVRVLCFPGIDGVEITQVYDQLRIPRKNIVGVERDKGYAQTIRESFPDIELWEGDLEKLVVDQERDFGFDIISLDYVGPFGPSTAETLLNIQERQTKRNFALHVANQTRRDPQSAPLYFIGHSGIEDDELQLHGANSLAEEYHRNVERRTVAFLKGLEGKEKQVAKSLGIFGYLRGIFYGGTMKGSSTLFDFAAGKEMEEFYQSVDVMLTRYLRQEVKLNKGNAFKLEGTGISGVLRPVVYSQLERFTYLGLRHGLDKAGIFHEKDIQFAPRGENVLVVGEEFVAAYMRALAYTVKKMPFFDLTDAKQYSYISEDGTPMSGVLQMWTNPERALSAARDIASMVNFPHYFELKRGATPWDLVKAVRAYSRALNLRTSLEDLDRLAENTAKIEFLGNSAKQILTKKRAIEEFRKGTSLEAIQAAYRGWDGKPLAAWKAHVTMGTYDHIPDDNGSIERISKEEAIELIQSGIPVNEIVEAYPTSFTKGQLRAFKSHVSIGTYD